MSPPRDPRAAIGRLYRDVHGYDADPTGEARVAATGSSATYGELMPAATAALVEHLRLGPRDAFYDLGSGVGKVVLQVAMTVPVARCVGIELMGRRHRLARRVLASAQAEGLLRARACSLRHGDFMRARMRDATVAYTCSTAFSTAFMNTLAARLARLPVGLRWVTTQDVDDNDWFRLEDVLRLDMSWRRRSKVHIYRLVSPAS
ncbi:MAG: hypothetical protein KDK70_21000 [Myxococcales bacterium]|nr:hypothetical protein [Myxococcales bacterium]